MTIIIPMAGLSQRFVDAGFTLPKYMLYVGSRSVFNITMSSFEKYFCTTRFLFIARNDYDTRLFIEKECEIMGIKDYEIVILEHTTRGQAETVYLGLKAILSPPNENIVIFNIDTIRNNFSFPKDLLKFDGYLEVFKGKGNNWSYAEPFGNNSQKVKRTAEKEEISDLCSTGLYYFKSAPDFCSAFEQYRDEVNSELYIAPLYNVLIKNDKEIYYHLIKYDEVIFTGVPSEYLQLVKSII